MMNIKIHNAPASISKKDQRRVELEIMIAFFSRAINLRIDCANMCASDNVICFLCYFSSLVEQEPLSIAVIAVASSINFILIKF